MYYKARYMGEVKNRSVRLDDENYAWLGTLPGRSLNEAIERLRLGEPVTTSVNGADLGQLVPVTAELLDLVRSLPDEADIERVVRVVMEEVGRAKIGEKASRHSVSIMPPSEPFEEEIPVVDKRPKNCRCRHCGKAFAGPRFTQICSECKSVGHTLSPAECPVCNEASAL